MSAFMAQAGHLVVCGDARAHFCGSIYEAVLHVRGDVASLGADCIEKEMRPDHPEILGMLLAKADIDARPAEFRHYGPAMQLYNFHVDNASGF